MKKFGIKTVWALACGLAIAVQAALPVGAAETVGPEAVNLAQSRQKAVEYLRTSQAADGSWTMSEAAGITALVAYGMLSAGVPADDPAVAKAMSRVESFAQPDGRICSPRSRHAGYETSVAVMALAAVNTDGKYDEILDRSEKFLRGMQIDEADGVKPSDVDYGGVGYGPQGSRPDLSNTIYFLEALEATGATKEDPAVQKALAFVSRCQNLESEANPTATAAEVNDGGFYYTPSAGGNSPAGNTPSGGLRSYGSMTYAGLKSMIYAGLTPEDPRVKAALDWIRQHYTIEQNPGLGDAGLYYYYQLFAKALGTLDLQTVKDADGEAHDWRKELADHLFSIQQPNGSWVNDNERWFEGDPNLATAYALMALKHCDPQPVKPGSR